METITGTSIKFEVVLGPDDLNDADQEVLSELEEGRVTPRLVADRRGIDRSYVSQRLIRLEEHGHVCELVRGLYELEDDPRDKDVGCGA